MLPEGFPRAGSSPNIGPLCRTPPPSAPPPSPRLWGLLDLDGEGFFVVVVEAFAPLPPAASPPADLASSSSSSSGCSEVVGSLFNEMWRKRRGKRKERVPRVMGLQQNLRGFSARGWLYAAAR